MNVLRARKLLGKIADNFSDEEISIIISRTKALTTAIIEKFEKLKNQEGVGSLDKVK